jgi:hypothetical protein
VREGGIIHNPPLCCPQPVQQSSLVHVWMFSCRSGYHEAAEQLSKAAGIEELVDSDIYEDAKRVRGGPWPVPHPQHLQSHTNTWHCMQCQTASCYTACVDFSRALTWLWCLLTATQLAATLVYLLCCVHSFLRTMTACAGGSSTSAAELWAGTSMVCRQQGEAQTFEKPAGVQAAGAGGWAQEGGWAQDASKSDPSGCVSFLLSWVGRVARGGVKPPQYLHSLTSVVSSLG